MRYERISIDPHVCSDKPCIRGTRIMVTNILELIAGSYTNKQILRTYPQNNLYTQSRTQLAFLENN